MLCGPVLLLCCCAVNSSQDATLSIDQLLAAHESARELIHAADVRINTVTHLHTPGDVLNRRIRWSFLANRTTERVSVSVDPNRPGYLSSQDAFEDYFLDNGKVCSLMNCDPVHTPPITVRHQQGVRASISPKSQFLPVTVDPTTLLLLSFTAYEAEPPRTLNELIREASSVKVVGRTNVEGHDLWQIHISYSREKDNSDFPFEFDVFLDPSVNFLARLVRTTQPTGRKMPANIVRTYRIMKFRDYGNGVFFPSEAEYNAGGDGSTDVAIISHVTEAIVNEDIPKDAFDFCFPQYTLVTKYPAVNGKVVVAIWGADNKPMAEFASPEEYASLAQKFDPAPVAKASTSRNDGPLRWSIVIACSVLICLCLLVLRYRHRSKRR
jgi:hypothetical protein